MDKWDPLWTSDQQKKCDGQLSRINMPIYSKKVVLHGSKIKEQIFSKGFVSMPYEKWLMTVKLIKRSLATSAPIGYVRPTAECQRVLDSTDLPCIVDS